MAKTLVGALRVTLGLDSAQFSAGAAKAQGTGERLGRSLRGIGIAAAGAAAGIALGVRGTINYADQMGEAAEKIGMPVEALTALRYAAEQTGVPFETLETSLLRLQKGLVDSPQKFADLGIAIREADGAMRPTADIMADIADKFQAMPDGAEKTALAMELFGKAGADMVLALNGGSDGLAALMQEARDLGIVLTDETTDAAGKFNENLDKLHAAAGGLGIQLMAVLAPTLERISGYAVDAAKAFSQLSPETKEMIAQVGAAIGVVGGAAVAFGLLSFALNPVSVTIGLIAGAAFLIYDNWDGIAAWFSEIWNDIKTSTREAWEDIKSAIGGGIDIVQAKWDRFVAALKGAIQIAKDVGKAIADALGVGAATPEDKQTFQEDWMSYGQEVPASYSTGEAMTDGIVTGAAARMNERSGELAAVMGMGLQVMKDAAQIASPSKVTEGFGRNLAEGLANGMTQAKDIVGTAAQGLTDTAAGAMEGIGDLGKRIGDMFAGAATNVLTGVESLSEAVEKLLSQLASMLINSAMKQLFGGMFGGLSLGGLPGYAGGTMSAAAGWAMVGEEGPELVRMRGGERVFDAGRTDRMLAGGPAGAAAAPTMVTQVYLDGELILNQIDSPQGEMVIARVNRRLGVS